MKLLCAIAALASITFALPAQSAANPVKGEELFKQCMACHAIGDGATHTVGPTLNHVFGRMAGSAEGYTNFSDAMKAKGDTDQLLWDEKSLYIFLAGPARYVPGTTMGFEGLRREQEIKDLLAYLITFSPAYTPESGEAVAASDAAAATLPVITASDEVETPEFTDEFMTTDAVIATGGDLWGKQCRHCHGSSAYPGKAPKLKPARYTPDFVFDRVTNGFRKMPGWKSVFTLEERKSLVAYVLSRKFSP